MYVLDNAEVVLTQHEYNEIMEDIKFLRALEAAGVDNWSGFDYAVEIYQGGQ